MTALASDHFRDPSWFLHQLDSLQRRALLLRVQATELAEAAFLDERLLADQRDGGWLEWSVLPPASSEQAPQRFIHHIGHCGSTLLSRLLDHWPKVLGLREPLVLRQLAELWDNAPQPTTRISQAQWEPLCLSSLGLLGRVWSPEQHIVLKATSSCNGLIAPLSRLLPHARSIFLWIPLEQYLATVLKSPSARRDAVTFAPARLGYLQRYAGGEAIRLHDLLESEVIALGWLAEMLRLQSLQSEPRLLSIDFNDLLQSPERELQRVAEHLRLPGDEKTASEAWASSISRQYAKASNHAYNRQDREHDLTLARQRFAVEIAQGLRWLDRLPQSLRPDRGL